MATIRKRKSGTYEIKVSCGYDVNGKQVLQFKHWKPPEGLTKRQIEKELQRQAVLFEEECKKGKITASIKFQTFAEQWFEEYAKINLRPTSYERMRQTTQRVYPALGHMKLDKITARHIQAFISDLYVNGKNQRNGKPLSRKTVVHHLNFISDIFAYAIKMDMLSDNPCRRVTVPKGESKEKEIYTIDEVKQIFQKLDSEPMNPQTPYGWFREFCKHNGFRFCDIHSLRHLHASLLIFEGVDVVAVSADMGHSIVGTTIPVPNSNTKTTAVHADTIAKYRAI